ncbi:MAG: WG repeat-containing protein [Verrucomicrobia bacterium]|nr:WG repeat-containing protein [Verrucomicrobiota bacterium]
MNASTIGIAAVKPVTSQMLDGSRLTRLKEEPSYTWAFRKESFWLERAEAAPLPLDLVSTIFGKGEATPWIHGKWSLSPDGATLTLLEVSGANGLATDQATIQVGLAALTQVTLAGGQYSVEEGGAADAPMFKSGQPVAFKDRSTEPPLSGFRSPATGAIVIPAIYTKATDFSPQGIACVIDGSEPHIIDLNGVQLTQPLIINDKPDVFREGLARCISDDGKMGYFNAAGEVTIPGRWTFVEPFSNGMALVNNDGVLGADGTVSGGLWGAINDLGQVVLKIDYAQLERGPGNTFRTSPEEQWFQPGGMHGE